MKKKVKNLLTITSIIVFSIIAIASSEDKSNVGKRENIGSSEKVSICRSCGLVVEGSNDILFPDNKKIKESCNNLIEGHLWYNAGRKGYNTFKCNNCGVEISIEETEPRCLTFCEIACQGKSKHEWSNTTTASSDDKSNESSEDVTNHEYVCPIHNIQMVDDGFSSYRCQKCYPDNTKMPFF